MEMCSAPWYAARLDPRKASDAGRIESAPPSSSLAAGPRRDERRSSRTATALTSIEPSTSGRSKASRASGWARRIRGSSRTASSSRAGPRRSGLVTSLPRSRLRPEATFSSPSSVRTATAQAVGPCTSTPFCSAIPPSRTFSAAMSRAYRRRHTLQRPIVAVSARARFPRATPTRLCSQRGGGQGYLGAPGRTVKNRHVRRLARRSGGSSRRARGRRSRSARRRSARAASRARRSSS
jgi:hypothetical protein